ncbi:hypothetical protein [Dechloromonas denitrificans]|uniref:hypothetical protein n=1 Tax=Dechloromonas denitrificans TaxID=281362 RepID=UPI0012FB5C97|nr:hypothetical protein [Dechloromonas denitrificans]
MALFLFQLPHMEWDDTFSLGKELPDRYTKTPSTNPWEYVQKYILPGITPFTPRQQNRIEKIPNSMDEKTLGSTCHSSMTTSKKQTKG